MEKSIEMDPGFKEFHQYCQANGFPFNVISAGLKPILRRVLDMTLGEKEVRRQKETLEEINLLISISNPVLRNRNRRQRRNNLKRRPIMDTNLAPRLNPRS
jgi:2-hydroxy-3-keto-5-methylthiopentenyl-1-phosphate phosphatase